MKYKKRYPMLAHSLSIVVGIATAGRREVLSETIAILSRQTRLPDRLIICPATDNDVDLAELKDFPGATSVVSGAVGLPAQRNRIIAEILADADIVVFFDDDFFPRDDYLDNIQKIFESHADVVAVTGRPIEDGINGPGLSVDYARSIIGYNAPISPPEISLSETFGTYGCNMAFRMDLIRQHGIRFDENLPLYGWQEDIDFSSQLSAYGRIVESPLLKGAHLGTKRGRSSGVRFGYSQIANPLYLIRKGTMPWSYAGSIMWRNLAANLVRSVRPEPWIDRRGRLKGNMLAFLDAATGRISPQRILQL